MSELSPYVHSCVEHPTLSCPACKWVAERRTAKLTRLLAAADRIKASVASDKAPAQTLVATAGK